jgi:hypothetical protein
MAERSEAAKTAPVSRGKRKTPPQKIEGARPIGRKKKWLG